MVEHDHLGICDILGQWASKDKSPCLDSKPWGSRALGIEHRAQVIHHLKKSGPSQGHNKMDSYGTNTLLLQLVCKELSARRRVLLAIGLELQEEANSLSRFSFRYYVYRLTKWKKSLCFVSLCFEMESCCAAQACLEFPIPLLQPP